MDEKIDNDYSTFQQVGSDCLGRGEPSEEGEKGGRIQSESLSCKKR